MSNEDQGPIRLVPTNNTVAPGLKRVMVVADQPGSIILATIGLLSATNVNGLRLQCGNTTAVDVSATLDWSEFPTDTNMLWDDQYGTMPPGRIWRFGGNLVPTFIRLTFGTPGVVHIVG